MVSGEVLLSGLSARQSAPRGHRSYHAPNTTRRIPIKHVRIAGAASPKKVGHMSRRFLIGPALLLLLLYPGSAAGGPFTNLTRVYEANFDDGTLNPSFDTLGVGPMQIGDTLVPGTNPSAVLEN